MLHNRFVTSSSWGKGAFDKTRPQAQSTWKSQRMWSWSAKFGLYLPCFQGEAQPTTWTSNGGPCSRINTLSRQVRITDLLFCRTSKEIFLLALVVITLTGTGTIPPSPWGGFYKNDQTLHQRRGEDTVPSAILFTILFVAPLITVRGSQF